MESIKNLSESYIRELVRFYSDEFKYVYSSNDENDIKFTEDRLTKTLLNLLEEYNSEIKFLNLKIELLTKQVENPELTDIRMIEPMIHNYDEYEVQLNKDNLNIEMFLNRIGNLDLDEEDLEAIKERNISWITTNIKEGQDFLEEEKLILKESRKSSTNI